MKMLIFNCYIKYSIFSSAKNVKSSSWKKKSKDWQQKDNKN